MTRPLLLLALVSAPALAEVVPLAHGTYVQTGTSCADPPFAMMRDYDGRGFPTPHSHDCRARVVARDGRTFVIENDCIGAGMGPAPRDKERMTIHVSGRTRYTNLSDGSDFRLCRTPSRRAVR